MIGSLLAAWLLTTSVVGAAPPDLAAPIFREDGALVFRVSGRRASFVHIRIQAPDGQVPDLDQRNFLPAGYGSLTVRPPTEAALDYELEVVEIAFAAPDLLGGHGQGPGRFRDPTSLAITPEGDLVVADRQLRRLQVLTPDGRYRFASEIPVAGGSDSTPAGVCVTRDGRIQAIDAAGRLLRFSGQGRPAGEVLTSPLLRRASGLAVIRQRDFLVALPREDRVVLVDSSGRTRRELGRFGAGPGQLRRPVDIALSGDSAFWVSEAGNHRIQRFDLAGRSQLVISQGLTQPRGLAVGPRGMLYVVDRSPPQLHVYRHDGTPVLQFPPAGRGRLRDPFDVAVSPAGVVYVSDRKALGVWRFQPSGSVRYKKGQLPARSVR